MKRFMPLAQCFSPGKTKLRVKTRVKTEDSMCADRILRVGTKSGIALDNVTAGRSCRVCDLCLF